MVLVKSNVGVVFVFLFNIKYNFFLKLILNDI